MTTLTPADAGALAAILHAAETEATVARLAPDKSHALVGIARYINALLPDSSGLRDRAAEQENDIRDLFLFVRLPGGREEPWLIRQLIAESPSGRFVPDFDLAAFEAAGGQAAVPASAAAWEAANGGPPRRPEDRLANPADLRDWPAEDLLVLARAAGMLWRSTGGSDPDDELNDGQRVLLDRAATSYLAARQDSQPAKLPWIRGVPGPAFADLITILHAAGSKSRVAPEDVWTRLENILTEEKERRFPDGMTEPGPSSGQGNSRPFKRGDLVEYLDTTASSAARDWKPATFDRYVTGSSYHVYVRPFARQGTVGAPALSTRSEVRRIDPELIRQARGHVADCQWEDVSYEEDVADLTDADVVRGIHRHVDGGWTAFRDACDPGPVSSGNLSYDTPGHVNADGSVTTGSLPGWVAVNTEAARTMAQEVRRRALVCEARDWIRITFRETDVAALSGDEVVATVNDHYEGGWAAYSRNEDAGRMDNPESPASYPATMLVFDGNGDLADAVQVLSQDAWADLCEQQPSGYQVLAVSRYSEAGEEG